MKYSITRDMPRLVASEAKKGDEVLCTNGLGTGFLVRGRRYVISEVTPTGYVRVEGSSSHYHASGRFVSLANATA
ncbi:hypothetical protein [Rhodoferax koreensis]|nr:hypothetical protein [Rhodoferax koreense]